MYNEPPPNGCVVPVIDSLPKPRTASHREHSHTAGAANHCDHGGSTEKTIIRRAGSHRTTAEHCRRRIHRKTRRLSAAQAHTVPPRNTAGGGSTEKTIKDDPASLCSSFVEFVEFVELHLAPALVLTLTRRHDGSEAPNAKCGTPNSGHGGGPWLVLAPLHSGSPLGARSCDGAARTTPCWCLLPV
jgi:hypothetical protein